MNDEADTRTTRSHRKQTVGSRQGIASADIAALENGVSAERFPSRIPAGEYQAVCYKTEIGRSFGGRRDCYVLFRVHSGPHHGTKLFMKCPYPEGKLSTRTKLYDQWMLAMQRAPHARERITPKVFRNRLYRVLVRDTKRKITGTNRLMPDFCQYSVIDTIIEVETGVPANGR